jgi:hypothetical protein
MSLTAEQLEKALQGTALEGASVSEKWPSTSADGLLLVELPSDEVLEGWEVLRGLVSKTERFPLIAKTADIDGVYLDEPPHESDLADGDFAKSVIQKSQGIDGGEELRNGRTLRGDFSPLRSSELFNWLEKPIEHPGHVLGGTMRRFGSVPDVAEILALRTSGKLSTDADLERWLLHWEIEKFGDAAIAPEWDGLVEWCDFSSGEEYALVLPNTADSWEGLPYMGWYGAENNAATKLAALRSWHERYGAELVCSFATDLQIRVGRRPGTVDQAFDLAIEQHHFAPDRRILSGVSLREHARALFSSDRWLLVARP